MIVATMGADPPLESIMFGVTCGVDIPSSCSRQCQILCQNPLGWKSHANLLCFRANLHPSSSRSSDRKSSIVMEMSLKGSKKEYTVASNDMFVTPWSVFVARIGKMKFSLSFFRLVWRSIFVVLVTILAMAMPFFNEMLALLGAMGFYPLTIYFPVEMYIARKKIKRGAKRWLGLKTLSLVFMLLSMAIACAAIHGMNQALRKYKFFMYKE
ncbi:hypothetical protein JHK85_040606 [Glycine max]|nr:hypothetical protein JHK85_040606 [Glycine max]